MPYAYKPDSGWALIMHDTVQDAVRGLEADPFRSMQQVVSEMVAFARPRLLEGAGEDPSKSRHASWFGLARNSDPHYLVFGETSPVRSYRSMAIERLQSKGRIDEHGFGLLSYSYAAPWSTIKLGWLTGERQTDSAVPVDVTPWRNIEWTAAPPQVIPEMLRAGNHLFEGVGRIARALDAGDLTRNASTLHQAVGLAAETYWVLSQAWPYMRGSASIADLTTKVIFDRLGIAVPLFRTDRYPNIEALLSPVEDFKAGYPSNFQTGFRWLQ